jgi:hypothetical protein
VDLAPPVPAVVFRPVGVTVVAVLGVLHAVWLLIAQLYAGMTMLAASDGVTKAVLANSGLCVWAIGSMLATFALGFVELFAAVYLVSLNAAARRALLVWSAAWVGLTAVGLAVNLIKVFPLMEQAHQQTPSGMAPATAKLISVAVAVALGILWPACVALYLHSARVVKAFRAVEAGAPML